tara:strand:+ start:57 stop:368 length:312 start_codon:yes stop_codon:yes gene_type:complete
MTKPEMDKLMKEIFGLVNNIRDAGQAEYARADADVFANFRRVASYTGQRKETVLLTYLMKHIDGIASHINGNTSQRENVTGRITDAIVYLCLLWGMEEDGGPA